MCSCVEYSVRSVAPKIDESSRSRFTERSTTVTSARRPTAISAAWVPDTPPPRITTLAGRHARHAAEQDAAAAVRLLQAVRADLDRHAARDFAHRREQRQRAVRRRDRFVRDAGRTRFHERLGLLRIRREVQVGVEDLALAQHRAFLRLRLLDLHDHVAGREDLFGGRGDLRADALVVRVGEADARRRTGLHEHFVARLDQFARRPPARGRPGIRGP